MSVNALVFDDLVTSRTSGLKGLDNSKLYDRVFKIGVELGMKKDVFSLTRSLVRPAHQVNNNQGSSDRPPGTD